MFSLVFYFLENQGISILSACFNLLYRGKRESKVQIMRHDVYKEMSGFDREIVHKLSQR